MKNYLIRARYEGFGYVQFTVKAKDVEAARTIAAFMHTYASIDDPIQVSDNADIS